MTDLPLFLKPICTFPELQADWIPRLAHVDVLGEREFSLRNLAPHHEKFIARKFPSLHTRHHAEQIHGGEVAFISTLPEVKTLTHLGADGLITNLPGQLLAIYVADCAAIYLADPITRAIALLHSGKKGTELNILANAVRKMEITFGTNPANLICVLSPCIRPPNYEINIAENIAQQARELGIHHFHDSCENTASDLTRHYSYRMEKGKTGRMLALLSIS